MDRRRTGAGQVTIGYGVTLLLLTYVTAPDWQQRALSLSIILPAAALGWLLGLMVSPYDPQEKERFAQYAGIISAFASGYVVGKIDVLATHIFEPDFILRPLPGFRVAGFITAVLVSMLWTHATRSYQGSGAPPETGASPETPAHKTD